VSGDFCSRQHRSLPPMMGRAILPLLIAFYALSAHLPALQAASQLGVRD
jgi:hypothetical protein